MSAVTRRAAVKGGAALAAAAALPAAAKGGPAGGGNVLDEHDALGLAALVKARKASPSELLEAAIARAEALNPRFNFMAQKHYDFARAAIAKGLPQGPFTGVPWLLKDLYTYIAGELTEGGSRFYQGERAKVTSVIAERHMAAGFVIFGKTTTPEFGLTGTTENKLTGDTRNPWNPAKIAGGSSGGAGAAVAAGVIPAAHATDGGGSIRIPACVNGLFGLKPSRGRVPMGPLRTEGWGGLSTHHAITRSVRDSAAILDVTHGIEPGSRYGAPSPREGFLAQVGRAPGKLRIALMLKPASGSPVDEQCLKAARDAAKLCESLGHHVEEAAPRIDAARLGWASFAIMGPSIAAEVADRAKATGLDPKVLLEPISQAFIEFGKTFSAMDMARANSEMQTAAIAVAQFMANYDVILSPTLGTQTPDLGWINLSPGVSMQEWGQRASVFSPFTQTANWTGQPSMSVPLGTASDGMPVGVLFTGRYGDEATLFRLAAQLEKATPWAQRRPSIA